MFDKVGAKMDSKQEFVAATQRSDGTWRKPVRIRKGFNPANLIDPFDSSSDSICDDNSSDVGNKRLSIDDSADRSSGHSGEAASRRNNQDSVKTAPLTVSGTGKGMSEGSDTLKQLLSSGPLDPYASSCNFIEAGGYGVAYATVASNLANEDRILIDTVWRFKFTGMFLSNPAEDIYIYT